VESYRSTTHPDALILDRPEAPVLPEGAAAEETAAPTKLSLKLEEVLMAATMAAIALITAANVVTRYLTNISLAFTEEFSTVLMVILAIVGTAYATAWRRHIRIGYFVDSLSPRGRYRAEMLALLATAVCFLVLLLYGAQMTWDDYSYGVLSPGLGYPQWVFSIWLPVFSALTLLRAGERAVHLSRMRRND
jgi:TRAP-type transport system small permease protein